MADVKALHRYRRYLELINREAPEPSDAEDYFELLTTGEAVDLLCARDTLAAIDLDREQLREIDRLDGLLVKHYRLIEGNVVTPPDTPRSHWWWFLPEGPQARKRAKAGSPKREPLS